MVLISEFRVPLPIDVDEFRVAQRYNSARYCRDNTKPGPQGEGFQILKNEPFDNELGKGQYSHKRINLANRVPAFVRALVPSTLVIDEHSWNAFPTYGKNVYTCPFFGDKFQIVVESKFLPDSGSTENALGLSAKQLKKRKVEVLDILAHPKDPKDYRAEQDPGVFISRKTGRGRLRRRWEEEHKPVMCVYKVATVEFKLFGAQDKGEKWLMKSMVRDVILNGHRLLFCTIDEWFGMTMDDVSIIEDLSIECLLKMRQNEDVSSIPLVPPEIRKRIDEQYPDLPESELAKLGELNQGDRFLEGSASGMRVLEGSASFAQSSPNGSRKADSDDDDDDDFSEPASQADAATAKSSDALPDVSNLSVTSESTPSQ